MAGDAGALKATISLENKDFLKAMDQVTAAVEKGTAQAGGNFQALTGFAEQMSGALAAVGIAGGFLKVGEMALEAAKNVDSLKAAFEALNGATEETDKLFNDLQELEGASMFDFEDTLGPAAKSMLQMGISAELVGKAMKGLVDTAAALKLPAENITAIANTFGVMNAKVIATDKDMRALAQNGVQAYAALADKIGISIPEAMEKVKAKSIESKTVIEAVAEAAEKKYGGAAEKTVETWRGAMNQLDQATEDVMVALGHAIKGALDAVAPALKFVIDGLKSLAEWFTALPEPIKTAIVVFGALVAGLTAATAAFAAMGPILTGAAAAFGPIPLAIAAVVAALVLLADWVNENWGAITATLAQAWDGVKETWEAAWAGIVDIFNGVNDFLKEWVPFWDYIAKGIQLAWDGLTAWWGLLFKGWIALFEFVWGAIKQYVGFIIEGAQAAKEIIGKIIDALPISDKLKTLGDTWEKETGKAKDAKAATEELTAARKQETEAAAKEARAAKAQADALQSAEIQAKAAAKEKKERDKEAKQAAQEAKKEAEELKKAYEALVAVSPELAAQFSTAMGGIAEATTKSAALFDPFKTKLSEALKQAIADALALADAFKGLGVTSEASLNASAAAADKNFATIKEAFDQGKVSGGEYKAALDKLAAAHQKIADYMNKDLKEAFDKGAIDAATYYQLLQERAEGNAAALIATGTATEAQLLAASEQAHAAREAAAKASTAEIAKAYTTLGVANAEALAKTAEDYKKYSDIIVKEAGEGSTAALNAKMKALDAERKALQALGKDFDDEQKKRYEGLKEQVENALPAVDKLEKAFKTLGVTSQNTLAKGAAAAAKELAEVKKQMDEGAVTEAEYYQATKKTEAAFQSLVDFVNAEVSDAFKAGKISADQYYAAAAQGARDMYLNIVEASDGSVEAIEAITAALNVVNAAELKVAEQADKDISDAFHSAGRKTKDELDAMAANALDSYGKIKDSAGENSVAAQQAWVNYLKILKQQHEDFGGEWTTEDERVLRETEKQLEDSHKRKDSEWDRAFKDIGKKAEDFSHDVIDVLLFGGGDKDKSIWENMADLATAALQDIGKELLHLASDEVIGLLTGKVKGLGDMFGGIGSLFGGGDKAAGGVADAVSGGGGGLGGAAGSVASSGVSAMVGMVTGIVSAVSGVIGNFQFMAMNKSLDIIVMHTLQTANDMFNLRRDEWDRHAMNMQKADEGLTRLNGIWDASNLHTLKFDDMISLQQSIDDGMGGALLRLDGVLNRLDGMISIGQLHTMKFDDIITESRGLGMAIGELKIEVKATGATTKEAAKVMGDQIAANLTQQLAGPLLR